MSDRQGIGLTGLPGIGPARAAKLARLGLERLEDVLDYFPFRYEDRRSVQAIGEAQDGQMCCVVAMVARRPELSRVRKGLELVKAQVVDDTGALHLTFFNQAYLKDALRPGERYVFYGRMEVMGRRRSMTNPVFEREGAGQVTGRILPVYPLTAGITNRLMVELAQRAVTLYAPRREETIPQRVRMEHGLCQVEFAYQNIHFPGDFQALEAARRRMIFEELFALTCGMALLKGRRGDGAGRVLRGGAPEEFAALLPFVPTGAQQRAMADIAGDLASGRAMNRLVQGDVGSGKTAVAAFGAWLCARSGCQCALMAPTELLAEQHARTLDAMLGPAGIRVGLLTGGGRSSGRKALLAALAAGEIDLLVGTHALFSSDVAYANLGLVIADEQHRFGVAQRAALAAKGATPGAPSEMGRRESGEGNAAEQDGQTHVLVMSATPIPRTLALIIYGDLDVSILDELPPGRSPVATYLVGEDKRQRLYGFVRAQVAQGRQVYIVCPAVEEGAGGARWGQEDGPALDLKAVTTYARDLQERVFPELRVGLVHGRMKAREKESVMAAFAAGEVDVLVATTVVEVGVDVPNAALMIIENAERFGLSQLHQLRGRVGRGKHQSYCVLVTSSKSEAARERLRALCATNDGFQIAEEDLRLRGPGDFFGKRQHGLPQLKVADFAADVALLQQAKQAAEALVASDPGLDRPEHAPLRRRVRTMFEQESEIFN
ncbi:MAG TPA: ATP-dependent DNA helicase RecG [Firmicutes bacterium]|nr:ATP-dependent DNA helicase RecG [Bacillota bacterium]